MIVWLCPQFGGLFSGWLRLLSKVGVIEIDIAFTVTLVPLLNFSKLLILASRKMQIHHLISLLSAEKSALLHRDRLWFKRGWSCIHVYDFCPLSDLLTFLWLEKTNTLKLLMF